MDKGGELDAAADAIGDSLEKQYGGLVSVIIVQVEDKHHIGGGPIKYANDGGRERIMTCGSRVHVPKGCIGCVTETFAAIGTAYNHMIRFGADAAGIPVGMLNQLTILEIERSKALNTQEASTLVVDTKAKTLHKERADRSKGGGQ